MSSEWISVDDRLPHWTDWIEVLSDLNETGEGFYHDPGWAIESRWNVRGEITHWRPAPPPFPPPFQGWPDNDPEVV